ncbi:hypothetical protein A2480_04330 [Candidatus Uhrbacteria bacterium RIFOXYC2_FULL_47_19]|uniref:Probable endonuclease 4 n=1 Tax=Candidatus Uhrbacteria bacterium RIFOXYC2_FULL_47_19 TaxID=1802424 RepID=A0A1F7WED1_9BACT|nr:MAG: hypothetical protein A2480_04330 [Candidatus Uhrbacteria bacterium RIFOXYC2_FULL_47_19]HCC22487.1 endonuclease [Candidatus Uhrbacteria bacterium]
MKIGAHVSAAGGLYNAPKNAAQLSLECFQFFSRPPQGGPVPKLGPEEISIFRQTCTNHGFSEYYVHTPYVLNICSDRPEVRSRTIGIIKTDLERASLLGCPAIMTHLGSANGVDEEDGLARAIAGVKQILDGYNGSARLLLENSAGAGKIIGSRFEELATIITEVADERIGICFDTAHAFASGYDLRNELAVRKTVALFDQTIGLNRLELVHANDSKVEFGTHKDRHEHIGHGYLGTTGFKAIISEPHFQKVNFILETPTEGQLEDIKLLKKMRNQLMV